MIIANNGIRLNVQQDGTHVSFVVEEQTKEATKILGYHKVLTDDQTGFSLRSNEKPSFNKKLKRFFLRGSDKDNHEKVVEMAFRSAREATNAIEALGRLINEVKWPEDISPMTHNIGQPESGGTTDVRFAIITKQQAMKLNLSAKNYFPEERTWVPKKGIVTLNQHYNEHISQCAQILNLATDPNCKIKQKHVINAHKINAERSTKALQLFRDSFDKAEREGYLIEFWRLVSAIRGPDDARLRGERAIIPPNHP